MNSDTLGSLLDAMGHLVGAMEKVVKADAIPFADTERFVSVADFNTRLRAEAGIRLYAEKQRDQARAGEKQAEERRTQLIDYIKARKPCEFCRRELDPTGCSCAGCVNRSLWEPWAEFPVPIVQGAGGINARDWREPVQ